MSLDLNPGLSRFLCFTTCEPTVHVSIGKLYFLDPDKKNTFWNLLIYRFNCSMYQNCMAVFAFKVKDIRNYHLEMFYFEQRSGWEPLFWKEHFVSRLCESYRLRKGYSELRIATQETGRYSLKVFVPFIYREGKAGYSQHVSCLIHSRLFFS